MSSGFVTPMPDPETRRDGPASGRAGFTLIEVLVAVAILGTAFVALVGLQSQSMLAMSKLTKRLEAGLWARDAFVRHRLREERFDVEPIHPQLREQRPDWQSEIEPEALTMEELPFVPVLPVGWKAEWINVRIVDGDGRTVASTRPLWAHKSEEAVPATGRVPGE